jgi:tRNA pseudouridine55 synthase
MIDGILLIDKEKGITSYDVIRKVKKVLGREQKIGHAGTLDPLATGLLILLLGKATKSMNTFHTYNKVYEVVGRLGFATDTQDIEGKIVYKDEKSIRPDIEDIKDIIEKNFLGDISQTPPRYSAKKIHGQKAYDLAREGKEFTLEKKDIHVSQFEVFEYVYPIIKCKIVCSTGTYIRTLIYDLGIILNTYATVIDLRRTSIGDFNVSEAISSKDIKKDTELLRRVIKI